MGLLDTIGRFAGNAAQAMNTTNIPTNALVGAAKSYFGGGSPQQTPAPPGQGTTVAPTPGMDETNSIYGGLGQFAPDYADSARNAYGQAMGAIQDKYARALEQINQRQGAANSFLQNQLPGQVNQAFGQGQQDLTQFAGAMNAGLSAAGYNPQAVGLQGNTGIAPFQAALAAGQAGNLGTLPFLQQGLNQVFQGQASAIAGAGAEEQSDLLRQQASDMSQVPLEYAKANANALAQLNAQRLASQPLPGQRFGAGVISPERASAMDPNRMMMLKSAYPKQYNQMRTDPDIQKAIQADPTGAQAAAILKQKFPNRPELANTFLWDQLGSSATPPPPTIKRVTTSKTRVTTKKA